MDNEATAELPVLDIAAYEATLNGEILDERTAHTDSWVVPNAVDATTEMPGISQESIPTLTASVPSYDLDHSGTHEMPAMPVKQSAPVRRPNKPAKVDAAPEAHASKLAPAHHVPAPIVVPPSPPLIEELRGALASAERRIEHLNERARIADAERTVAVDRANAESAQLREQLGAHFEALSTARERLAVQRTDQAELADELFRPRRPHRRAGETARRAIPGAGCDPHAVRGQRAAL